MIEVTIDHQREQHLVEFLVQAEHKHDFVARESNTDLMAAVDLGLDENFHADPPLQGKAAGPPPGRFDRGSRP